VEAARAAVTQADAALSQAREGAETAEHQREEAEQGAKIARGALDQADAAMRAELDAARNAARDALSTAERTARDSISQADRAGRDAVSVTERTGREQVEAARSKRSSLAAEVNALRDLQTQDDEGGQPVLEQLDVASGFETALGAAFGDDLDAALDEAASRHWIDLGALPNGGPDLPAGVVPLSKHVRAPESLARRLSQVGVAEDGAMATRLQRDLLV
ncbi:MAG TPA: hypothetical protein DCL95_16475, partial [Rhodospirillaceae bacterium]|nr:hypothetical protein [Rhodospirillaceae bacterium]